MSGLWFFVSMGCGVVWCGEGFALGLGLAVWIGL